jgi:hypothetical protein
MGDRRISAQPPAAARSSNEVNMPVPTQEQANLWGDFINSDDIYPDAIEEMTDIVIDGNTVTIEAIDYGEPPRVPRKVLRFTLEFDDNDDIQSVSNELIGGDELESENFSYADFEDCEDCHGEI